MKKIISTLCLTAMGFASANGVVADDNKITADSMAKEIAGDNATTTDKDKGSMMPSMNKDVIKGNWTKMVGAVKKMWGNLTDDDITKINGDLDVLCGTLQAKYGYSKEEAEKAVQKFMADNKDLSESEENSKK